PGVTIAPVFSRRRTARIRCRSGRARRKARWDRGTYGSIKPRSARGFSITLSADSGRLLTLCDRDLISCCPLVTKARKHEALPINVFVVSCSRQSHYLKIRNRTEHQI